MPDPSDDDDYVFYVANDDRLNDDDRYIPDDNDKDDDEDEDDDKDEDDESAVGAEGGSGGYEYLGCYTDRGTGRILNTMVYDDAGNTVVVSICMYVYMCSTCVPYELVSARGETCRLQTLARWFFRV